MGADLAFDARPLGGRDQVARATAAVRTESGLAVLAIGLLALHVVDDNFLQPQPGTSAADHLVSGLVPLALLAVFAVRYGRLRRGSARSDRDRHRALRHRAAAWGRPATTRSTVGPSGDDYTGLLAIPAGLLLAGVGVAALWRSRRLDDGLLWRYARRSLLTACAVRRRATSSLGPLALSYVFSHAARAEVPAARLGTAYEKRRVQDGGRPHAARLVRAVEERRGRDLGARASGLAEARADARAPRLRRPALRSPRRGRERRRSEHLRLGRREGSRTPRSPSCSGARTSIRTASADRALAWAARRCCGRRPNRTASAAIVSDGAGSRLDPGGPRAAGQREMGGGADVARDQRRHGALLEPRCRRRRSAASSTASRRGRCSSSTASTTRPTSSTSPRATTRRRGGPRRSGGSPAPRTRVASTRILATTSGVSSHSSTTPCSTAQGAHDTLARVALAGAATQRSRRQRARARAPAPRPATGAGSATWSPPRRRSRWQTT